MDNCVFCKIVKGAVPCAKIWEDNNYLAFADIYPVKPGHTLVMPKKHISYIFDMEKELLSNLMEVCKPIAEAIKQTVKPNTGRVGIMVAGVDVPHVHIHLIPMDEGKDLNFANAKPNTPRTDINKIADKIKGYLT